LQAVAVRSLHRTYQLKAADLTCTSMSDLSVYNMRRLFAMRGSEFMDVRKQGAGQQEHKQHGGRWKRFRTLRNATIERPDDRPE
jgi:hypothetical protein